MSLKSEIFEQPIVLAGLLKSQKDNVQTIAQALHDREIDYIFLAARGTSDNAGLYAKYLYGGFNHIPMALATPSLFSIYNTPPVLKNALVIGISQSGQSPDIISVLAEGKRQGAPTLAIVNAPDSPMAQTADFVIDVSAGSEKAVAATKTYTAQLMAIAMLSAALGENKERLATLERVPEMVEETLKLDKAIEHAAERYRYMERCVVLARGYNYGTAFEWALKLKELTYVIAEPYSSADFLHGPIAIVNQGFPVLAIAPKGAVFPDMLDLLARLSNEHQAELLVVSNEEKALGLARTPLCLPAELPEWTSPLVSIVPAQLFCYYLTRAKGYDTESPRGLSKVTLTH
jgi:glucosamine--fructose-6-phosphate aminotransferase (isomerizing)